MSTLRTFSDKEREHDRYEQRMEYLRVQATIEEDLRRMGADKQKAEQEKQKALERERKYKEALMKAGIDPDSLV